MQRQSPSRCCRAGFDLDSSIWFLSFDITAAKLRCITHYQAVSFLNDIPNNQYAAFTCDTKHLFDTHILIELGLHVTSLDLSHYWIADCYYSAAVFMFIHPHRAAVIEGLLCNMASLDACYWKGGDWRVFLQLLLCSVLSWQSPPASEREKLKQPVTLAVSLMCSYRRLASATS